MAGVEKGHRTSAVRCRCPLEVPVDQNKQMEASKSTNHKSTIRNDERSRRQAATAGELKRRRVDV